MNIELVTAPVRTPVNLADMLAHLRVDEVDEYLDIEQRIQAGTVAVEEHTGRRLITQTVDIVFDLEDWQLELNINDGQVQLRVPPLQSITTIKTYDSEDNETTEDASDYSTYSTDPAWLRTHDEWVGPSRVHRAVVIRAVVGYGTDVEDVPGAIREALRKAIAQGYWSREEVVVGTVIGRLPHTVEEDLRPWTVDDGF